MTDDLLPPTRSCLNRPLWLLGLLIFPTALLALMVGSTDLAPADIFHVIFRPFSPAQPNTSDQHDTIARIVLLIRLPRIMLALAIGAGMGIAGVASQTLFRNPLASPYVIGVSNGAALGAVVGMLLVGNWFAYGAVALLSVIGGLTVAMIVLYLARRAGAMGYALLLAGIAISALCSALTAAVLYLAGERLQTLVFWLMGGLWQANWGDTLMMSGVLIPAGLFLLYQAPALNVSLLGERSATDLGIRTGRLQVKLLLVIALLTSVAVSLSGVIGFIGLIVPHVLRLHFGADHRRLIPASAAGGALLLLVADTLARTLARPAEIPVGILTAMIGAPVFLWMLLRHNPQREMT